VITTTCLAIPCVSTFFSNVFIIALRRLNANTSIACVALDVDVVARVSSSSRVVASSLASAFAYTSSSAPSIRRRTAIFARVHVASSSSLVSVVVVVVVVFVLVAPRARPLPRHPFRASSRLARSTARPGRARVARAAIARVLAPTRSRASPPAARRARSATARPDVAVVLGSNYNVNPSV
jgi:hypothetical protein